MRTQEIYPHFKSWKEKKKKHLVQLGPTANCHCKYYMNFLVNLCLFFFVVKGTTQENLDKLIQNVQIESDSDMIKNWQYLGVPIIFSVRNFFFTFNFLTLIQQLWT